MFMLVFTLLISACDCTCPSGERCNDDGTCTKYEKTEQPMNPSFP